MLNISIVVLLSVILVYSNVIILNEETLILVCFITFSLIAFNKLKGSISEDLQKDSNKIEFFVLKSFKELQHSLESILGYKSTFQHIIVNFQSLKNHVIIFGNETSKELPNYVSKKIEITYPKKLIFIKRLENQTGKLLALLVNQKLNKITSIQNFYTYNCKVTNFLCINKIILREYFQVI
uniref:ATP synthase F0 subunit 4 n=1 Tax=Hypnea cervicornis TaxID=387623 RepID=UPI0021B6C3C9|nr:ATP synthase F0 subunit 4 [Hypnea cervicornis]UVW80590.1 ATP synthase F0 subunit 4 [Hypnea cervicornis]